MKNYTAGKKENSSKTIFFTSESMKGTQSAIATVTLQKSHDEYIELYLSSKMIGAIREVVGSVIYDWNYKCKVQSKYIDGTGREVVVSFSFSEAKKNIA